MAALERELKPYIDHKTVARHYAFEQSSTGVRRVVDFDANSGRNLALDALKLSLRRADDIRLRADAEAYKVHDVVGSNSVSFLVFCDFSPAKELAQVNKDAQRAIESAGALVITDMGEAVKALQAVVPA